MGKRIFAVMIFLSFVSQSASAAEPISVAIDASKTAAPISKYIYGQFIEHLGDCVYQGIWAEMIKDRKFLFDFNSDKSPWTKTGDSAAVIMLDENPYVGKQTPQITVTGESPVGIKQSGLGLLKDKKYTGRVILAAAPGVKVEVRLVWGQAASDQQTVTIENPGAEYAKYALEFTARQTTTDATLQIVGSGTASFRIGTVSLMPADNVEGMRADTLELLKQLDSPIYRWPGGNFVSGYDWRDGIGKDRDKRPPKHNLAWGNSEESNDFGIDEFLTFCRLLNTEPSIAVNTGFGDAHSAAEEVEYVNGSPDTPMGKLRAENGHPEPYNVKWWYVGNEMFGDWQLGFMKLDQYVVKHNLAAEAMWQADPSIKLIGSGNVGYWSEKMLDKSGNYMDALSEHFYVDRKQNPDSVPKYVRMIPDNVARIVKMHKEARRKATPEKAKQIPVIIDEWNYWMGNWPYNIKDAMGIAAGLHEMVRNSDVVYMANYAQTVNIMGAIKTNKTDAVMVTTGLTMEIYRKHFGRIPVEVTAQTGNLDIVAACTDDKKALTIAIVNPTETEAQIALNIRNASLAGNAHLWQIADPDPMTHNTPGQPMKAKIDQKELSDVANKLVVPGYSISIYKLPVQ